MELEALLRANRIDWSFLEEEARKDITLVRIRQALEEEINDITGFTLEEGKLFFKGRYLLSKTSPFIPVILLEYQNSPIGEHTGYVS